MVCCPKCQRSLRETYLCPHCGAQVERWRAPSSDEGSGPAAPSLALARLDAHGLPVPIARWRLVQPIFRIGRHADLSITGDPHIAPIQAHFFFQGPTLYVEDVGGGNGIFMRISESHPLRRGAELRCGQQRLIFAPLDEEASPRCWGAPLGRLRGHLYQLLEGGRIGDVFPLYEGDNFLGRREGDAVFLPKDEALSERHALLALQGSQALLCDLNSQSGTFLKINAPLSLQAGDQLLMGNHLLSFEL